MPPETEVVNKDEEQEEEFIAVEDEVEGKAPKGPDDETLDEEHEERLAEGEEEEQDERLAADQEDEEDKKERRRSENKSRRQRQKEARDRTERELKFLQTRNEELERRFSHFEQETDARVTGSEIASIDVSINKARSDMQLANQVIEQAVTAQDGKNLAEALTHRDTIRDNLRDLNQAKQYLANNSRRGEAPVQQQLDPRHVAHAQKFMIDNEWWDPNGRDPDSKIVLDIDRSLVQEGYQPATKDYWDELRARSKEALPKRFETRTGSREDGDGGEGSGNGQQKPAGSRGPQFRTGGRERPLKKNEVYISPERKEAMIEAGVWEDPVLRNKYLKSYATYDQEAAAETGA
jgi:hypothetical protein